VAALFADEDIPDPLPDYLVELGHDVLTALTAGRANQNIPDHEVLAYATSLRRAVLTHNRKDYKRLHRSTPTHAGIVICTRDDFALRDLAARIDAALSKHTDLAGQLVSVTKQS
jgi:Domain of unknown function (DUF5615)